LCLGLLLAASAACAADKSAACAAPAFAETAVVHHVHDGDTVQLVDGRRLRLIGIDAPELARDNHPAQPFGLAARAYLRRLMQQHGDRVGLVFDTDKQDKYGRSLAHLFFTNGTSVAAALLDAGLAVAYTTPPDDHFSACYREHEASARLAGREIWNHPKYRDLAATELSTRSNGFHIVHARVLHSNNSRKGFWLDLEGGLAIQIKADDLANFEPGWLAALTGKTIQIRGWLHPKSGSGKNRFYMQLRHPDNLLVL
jgi:endonuclease YncB( thermonuclease family)